MWNHFYFCNILIHLFGCFREKKIKSCNLIKIYDFIGKPSCIFYVCVVKMSLYFYWTVVVTSFYFPFL